MGTPDKTKELSSWHQWLPGLTAINLYWQIKILGKTVCLLYHHLQEYPTKKNLKNMNTKVAEYFLKHWQVQPENDICIYFVSAIVYTYIKCRTQSLFFTLQLLINISSSVIHSIYKLLLNAYYRFCSMLDSGDSEMRCLFEGGR